MFWKGGCLWEVVTWICDCYEILEMLDFQSIAEKEVKGRIQRINGTIDNVVCICIDYE